MKILQILCIMNFGISFTAQKPSFTVPRHLWDSRSLEEQVRIQAQIGVRVTVINSVMKKQEPLEPNFPLGIPDPKPPRTFERKKISLDLVLRGMGFK
jgi:hypothetical protein